MAMQPPERPPRIALVAHDGKKDEMLALLREFLPALRRCRLVATAGTGSLVRAQLGLDVALYQSGPRGGDQQIGALVASEQLDAVVFLRDPLEAQPHEPDVSALMRVCDVHNVPLATNPAAGRAVLAHLLGAADAEGR